MAQLPRTVPLGVTTSVGGTSRTPVVARGSSTGSSQPIGDMAGSVGVSYDENQFQFRDYQGGNGGRAGHDQSQGRGSGHLQAPTEFFVKLYDQTQTASEIEVVSTSGSHRNVSFEGLLTHAINSYETNARVIHETAPTRGTSMSFQL